MKELKADMGIIPETELIPFLKSVGVEPPTTIQFPFGATLSQRHTLAIERNQRQVLSKTGLVNQLNWQITENMVNMVERG